MPLSSFPLWFAAYLAVRGLCAAAASRAARSSASRGASCITRALGGGRAQPLPCLRAHAGLFRSDPRVQLARAARALPLLRQEASARSIVLCEAADERRVSRAACARYGVSVALALGLAFELHAAAGGAVRSFETFEIPDRFRGHRRGGLGAAAAAGGRRAGGMPVVQGLGGAALAAGVWARQPRRWKSASAASYDGRRRIFKLYALAGLYLGAALNLLNVAGQLCRRAGAQRRWRAGRVRKRRARRRAMRICRRRLSRSGLPSR
jgi:hypothetical protein